MREFYIANLILTSCLREQEVWIKVLKPFLEHQEMTRCMRMRTGHLVGYQHCFPVHRINVLHVGRQCTPLRRLLLMVHHTTDLASSAVMVVVSSAPQIMLLMKAGYIVGIIALNFLGRKVTSASFQRQHLQKGWLRTQTQTTSDHSGQIFVERVVVCNWFISYIWYASLYNSLWLLRAFFCLPVAIWVSGVFIFTYFCVLAGRIWEGRIVSSLWLVHDS